MPVGIKVGKTKNEAKLTLPTLWTLLMPIVINKAVKISKLFVDWVVYKHVENQDFRRPSADPHVLSSGLANRLRISSCILNL